MIRYTRLSILFFLIALFAIMLIGCSGQSAEPDSSNSATQMEKQESTSDNVSLTSETLIDAIKPKKSEYEQLFEDGPILAESEDGLTGYINNSGDWVIDPVFYYDWEDKYNLAYLKNECDKFENGIARVKDLETELWGFVGENGEWEIEAQYLELRNFSEDLAAAKDNLSGLWGFIDRNGEWVILPQYQVAKSFSQNMAAVCDAQNHLFGYINKKGEYEIAPKYERAQLFSEDRAFVMDPDTLKYMIIDTSGVQVPLSYDVDIEPMGSFENGRAFAVNSFNESVFYMIGTDGTIYANIQSDRAVDALKDGNIEWHNGYIKLGAIILDYGGDSYNIHSVYELLQDEDHDPLSPVSLDKVIVISNEGNIVLPAQHDENREGKTITRLDGYDIVDIKTGEIVGPRYNFIFITDGEIRAIDDKGAHVIDGNGKIIRDFPLYGAPQLENDELKMGFKTSPDVWAIDCKFDGSMTYRTRINEFVSDVSYAIVKYDGLWGVIDKQGNWLIESNFLNLGINGGISE